MLRSLNYIKVYASNESTSDTRINAFQHDCCRQAMSLINPLPWPLERNRDFATTDIQS